MTCTHRFISQCRIGDPFIEVFPDWKKDLWENWTEFVRNQYSGQDPFKRTNQSLIYFVRS